MYAEVAGKARVRVDHPRWPLDFYNMHASCSQEDAADDGNPWSHLSYGKCHLKVRARILATII